LSRHAVLCTEAIKDVEERKRIMDELTITELNYRPLEVIELSLRESASMCSNMFNLLDENHNHCVIMSDRAHRNFNEENLKILQKNYKLIVTKIDTIEHVGGGSCRCMCVELF
jgi:hypothetical protein